MSIMDRDIVGNWHENVLMKRIEILIIGMNYSTLITPRLLFMMDIEYGYCSDR